MTINRKKLEDDLMHFVRSRSPRHAAASPQMDLLESGLLDSLLLVDLIFQIEESYGVRFDSDQVNPSNFRTVEDIVGVVLGQLPMPQPQADWPGYDFATSLASRRIDHEVAPGSASGSPIPGPAIQPVLSACLQGKPGRSDIGLGNRD